MYSLYEIRKDGLLLSRKGGESITVDNAVSDIAKKLGAKKQKRNGRIIWGITGDKLIEYNSFIKKIV